MVEFDTAIFVIAGKTWFIWLPLFLVLFFSETWLASIRAQFRASVKWTLLEVKIPREIKKRPQSDGAVFCYVVYGVRGERSRSGCS